LTDFGDVVLFRIVRFLSEGDCVRESWIQAAVPIAVNTRDHSLIETLLLVLRGSASRFPELVAVAIELTANSKQINRVVRNVLGGSPA